MILDWLVHHFLVMNDHEKAASEFLEAIGLRITNTQELDDILEVLIKYSLSKSYGEVGYDNRASNGNAPATLQPTQDLAPVYPLPHYYHNFPQAEPQNPQYHVGFDLAPVYPLPHYYHNFPQAEPQNQQYANSMHASTAGQSHANLMRISTAEQSRGLSDSGYQLSNSHKRRRL